MWPTPVGSFHRLTINDPCTWGGFPTRLQTTVFPQRRHDLFPHSFISKPRKIAIDRRARGVLSRQHVPGTPSSQEVKDRIEHRSHIDFTWSSAWLLRRDQLLKDRPLLVCEVGGIDFHRRPPFLHRLTPVFSPCPTYSTIVHPPDSGSCVSRLHKPFRTRSSLRQP